MIIFTNMDNPGFHDIESHQCYFLKNRSFPSLWKKCREDPEIILKDYRPADDLEFIKDYELTPSPDGTLHVSKSFEKLSTNHSTVLLHHDVVKLALLDHMKINSQNLFYLEDIEKNNISEENLDSVFKDAKPIEVCIAFLWTAFLKRWVLLHGLLKLGADLSYHDPVYGLSALHLSAFSGCEKGTEFLLSKGSDPNAIYRSYSPLHCAAFGNSPKIALTLIKSGASLYFLRVNVVEIQSVLHCAVRANSVGCVQLFGDNGADVNQLDSFGYSPIHLAAKLGYNQCLEILVKVKGVNINAHSTEMEKTALHLAVERLNFSCMDILFKNGVNPNVTNYRSESPLHLAVRQKSYQCVKQLLEIGKADPNLRDYVNKAPLHMAICKADYKIVDNDIVELLIMYGADVNARDQYGYTPLHLAALKGIPECIEILLLYDADITAKSKSGLTALGLISKKSPTSLEVMKRKLDQSITFQKNSESTNSREVELRFDFSTILQHCHPKEITFLNTFVDEGHKDILLHPLSSAFLYLKWKKIRKYYISRSVFYFFFALCLSGYVLIGLAHNCYNLSKNVNDTEMGDIADLCENKTFTGSFFRNHPYLIEMQWYVLLIMTLFIIFRKICGIPGYTSVTQYLANPENIMEWWVIINVFLISFVYTGRTYTWQNHLSAFSVLLAWINLMYMVGQLPVFGPYVAMYTSVQGEFAKLFLVYSCLLVGFTVSFCVLFPDSTQFSNPFIGLITVLVMSIGDMNFDLVIDEGSVSLPFFLEISMEIIYALFVLSVTIVLMNLLIGIAVHDIQGLQKTAGLSKLVRQTKLISNIELALFNDYFHRKILLDILQWTTLVSSKAYGVINVNPLNPREKRLPRDVIDAGYQIAKRQMNKYDTDISSTNAKTVFSSSLMHNFDLQNYTENLTETEKIKSYIRGLSKEIREIKDILKTNQNIVMPKNKSPP